MTSVFENNAVLPKICEKHRKLAKISENLWKSPKIGENRRKLVKIAENSDHNLQHWPQMESTTSGRTDDDDDDDDEDDQLEIRPWIPSETWFRSYDCALQRQPTYVVRFENKYRLQIWKTLLSTSRLPL
jgi:hypothetical protein